MRTWHFPGWIVITAALCSCGGGDNSPSGPTDPGLPESPNPESVTVTMDPGRMASARIPTSGGSLQATGADGTVYTLTVPPDALVSDTTITMTPITSVSGLDSSSGDRTWGVQLEPDGLRFFTFATLTFAPPEGANHQVFAFSYHGTGNELHRVPLTPDPNRLEIKLLHFTGFLGRGNVEGTWVAEPQQGLSPTDYEDLAQAEIARVFQDERDRLARGEEIDPERAEKLQEILQAYWERGVEPTLNTMMTDCQAAQTLAPRALAFERTVELLGFHDVFLSQEGKVHSAAVAALENCFRQTVGECLDRSNAQQMKDAAAYSRQLNLIGIDDPEYNVANPDLYCAENGWTGTTTRTLKLDGNVTDVITGSVIWEIDPEQTHPGIATSYRVKEGSITWEQTGTDADGCIHHGGPQTFNLVPADGVMAVDEINHTYQATGVAIHYTQVTVTCPPTLPSGTTDVSASDWLVTPVAPFDTKANELSGSYEFGDITYRWRFITSGAGK